MKKYFITLLLFFYFIAGYGQATYYVSVVKGRVLKANGAVIKGGDKLTEKDKVSFTSKTDQLILLNPGSGRLLISPQYSLSEKNISFTGFIKDFLELSEQQKRLSATAKRGDSLQIKKQPILRADAMKEAFIKNR